MEKKRRIVLEDYEWRIVINALNDFRTALIREERYTDAVDDVLIKIIEAKNRKFLFWR
ncbi:MAG: hypothetical protein IJ283_01840 [Oscillospiraceae bacterium]|nr:hypothetical protein [Oscillospiraceae bacterium]